MSTGPVSSIPYGLALYKLEAERLPLKCSRRLETQSASEDVARLLEAQSAAQGDGDDTRSSSGLPALSDEAAGSETAVCLRRPRTSTGEGFRNFRARQLREAPRLAGDLAQLSLATAAPPAPLRTAPSRACSKAPSEPPKKNIEGRGFSRRPEAASSLGRRAGWYNNIPHAAQRIRACREAAQKAGDLPEVMNLKVLDSKNSRQAWATAGESIPPSPRQAGNKAVLLHGAETMQMLGLTMHVPEVPQFEEEKMPDRVSHLAKQLRIPLDTLKQAYEVFWEICTTLDHPMASKGKRTNKKGEVVEEDFDVFQDGELNIDGFAKVLCKLIGCLSTTELPEGLVQRSFRDADGNGTKSISFLEFAFWYSRHGFMENMLLTSAQQEVRQLARKYELPVIEVEQYKKKFDLFDEDHSGAIDYQEFQKLLSTLIKVPAHLELPVQRMNQFWAEADRDRSQLISFEEFLLFFYRYFRLNTPSLCPFQEYYRGIRRVRVAYPEESSRTDGSGRAASKPASKTTRS